MHTINSYCIFGQINVAKKRYSVYHFTWYWYILFVYSRCPPWPAFCKSGGARAPVPHGVGASGRTDCIICFRLPRERFL